jgi:hypothetical protein
MSLLDSPPIFIVGAQRSGTTWVQRLLAAHPRIVGGQESHLFSGYLAPLWKRWRLEADLRASGSRTIGLGCYLTEEQFLDTVRQFAANVFTNLESAKPGATRLLEKTPDHALHLPLIRRVFPEASLIHVVRDGRDVVASLRDAHRQRWGRSWTPATIEEAARRWVEWVEEIRSQVGTFARVHEVRYEDLLLEGPKALAELFAFLELPLPADQVEAIYEQHRFEAAGGTSAESLIVTGACASARRDEPAGFYRKGKAGGWQQDLSAAEQDIVESIAGDLLQTLGYTQTPLPPLAPVGREVGGEGGPTEPVALPRGSGFVSTAPPGDLLWVGPGPLDSVLDGNAQMLVRERLYLYATVLALAPRRCLEIGVGKGGSTRIIHDALKELGRGRLIAVGPRPDLADDLAPLAGIVTFLAGESPRMLRQAQARAGGPFDFVLLDGDHREEGVRRDLEGLVAVTRPGAVILAHDAYFPLVAAGIDSVLAAGLPYTDAGIVSQTCHPGLENGLEVTWAGLRLLVRAGPASRRSPRRAFTEKVAAVVRATFGR